MRKEAPVTAPGVRIALAALLLTLTDMLALGCGSSPPQEVVAAGVAAYSPVPSDALPVRRADADALRRLTLAVQGLRYVRADDRFSLAPAAFSGLLPVEPLIESREVVRLGDVRIFWVEARTESVKTFTPEQLELLAGAERVEVSVEVTLPTHEDHPQPGARAEALVASIHEAHARGIRKGLEELYEGRTVPAHGRVFLLHVQPVLEDDDEQLPKDPAPLGLRRGEYRYRLGHGLASPEPDRLRMHLTLWVVPDVPIR